MIATRKIFKAGNSLVVALPKEILEQLRLQEGTEVAVDVNTDEKQIIISPAQAVESAIDVAFAQQIAEFIEEYRPALEALAR